MTRPFVSLEEVDVMLDGQPVLHRISWSLRPGENWAILGRNGSGKTTLLKLIRGELWPAPGGPGRRLYAFDGDEQTTAVGIKEKIAVVSPELQARYLQQEWTLTVAQVIDSGFRGGDYVYQKLTPAQRERAVAVIGMLRLEDLLGRNVQTLSTGELRKVLIGRALAGAPRVLVCDEICDGLDPPSRVNLLELLDRLAGRGTQMLFTTHREEELFPGLSHWLRLDRGRIVEAGPLPRRPARVPRVAETPARARATVAVSRGSAPGRMSRPARTLIRISKADVYLAREPALVQVNFEIRSGEHWAVLGPNGSGKSTLLRLIVGDLHPAWGGRVQRFEFTARNSLWQIKRRIGLVSPELQANYRESIIGFHAIASGFFGGVGRPRLISGPQQRKVNRLVAELGLEELARTSILQMSYGEFRRILIARALVHAPDLLLCDEPYDGLDAAARQAIAGVLERVASRGTSLVVVTHHAGDLPRCTTHFAELTEGRIVRQGPIQSKLG